MPDVPLFALVRGLSTRPWLRSRDMDLMREPDIVNLDPEEEWLCPECSAPYSKDAIESELVA